MLLVMFFCLTTTTAQIYNEIEDFHRLADALKVILADRSKFLQNPVGKSYLFEDKEE